MLNPARGCLLDCRQLARISGYCMLEPLTGSQPCSGPQVGMTFTIEPILVEQGTGYRMWKDEWTVVAKDGGLSAQWEHTVLITPTGYEILTLP